MTISLKTAGAVLATAMTVALLTWDTLGGPEAASKWALALSAMAAVMWVWVIDARQRILTVEAVRLEFRLHDEAQRVPRMDGGRR